MNFRSLNKAFRAATDRKVLAVSETLTLQQGRELIRKTIKTSLAQEGL